MKFRHAVSCAALAASCLAYGLPAHAQQAQPAAKPAPSLFGFVLEGAAEFGGDEVAEIYFDDNSSQSVDAGQGLSAALGFYVRPAPEWSVRATVGYKYVSTKASNADIYLDRVPVNLIASWHFENGIRLGAGGVWHTGIKFHGDNIAPDFKFDDAFGYTLEAGWRWIVASYTGMDYKDEYGFKYKADSYGVRLVWEF